VFENRIARRIFGDNEMKKQEDGENDISKRFLISTYHILVGRSRERDERECSTQGKIRYTYKMLC
jgi:hypothetical protein